MACDYDKFQLGLNIRFLRHKEKITQAELAQRMGCCRQKISNIENGQKNISVDTLFSLCQALKCSTGDILKGV